MRARPILRPMRGSATSIQRMGSGLLRMRRSSFAERDLPPKSTFRVPTERSSPRGASSRDCSAAWGLSYIGIFTTSGATAGARGAGFGPRQAAAPSRTRARAMFFTGLRWFFEKACWGLLPKNERDPWPTAPWHACLARRRPWRGYPKNWLLGLQLPPPEGRGPRLF